MSEYEGKYKDEKEASPTKQATPPYYENKKRKYKKRKKLKVAVRKRNPKSNLLVINIDKISGLQVYTLMEVFSACGVPYKLDTRKEE